MPSGGLDASPEKSVTALSAGLSNDEVGEACASFRAAPSGPSGFNTFIVGVAALDSCGADADRGDEKLGPNWRGGGSGRLSSRARVFTETPLLPTALSSSPARALNRSIPARREFRKVVVAPVDEPRAAARPSDARPLTLLSDIKRREVCR